jgi:seryl-tRNA synthetase
MPDAVIVSTEPPAPATPPAEIAAATVEAETAHAEARVEVAEIEANRDVAIADRNAEVAEAAIEAAAENEAEEFAEEIASCQQTIATQATEIQALRSEVQSIRALLEPIINPPNPQGERTSEADPAKTELPPNQETPKPKRRVRWI